MRTMTKLVGLAIVGMLAAAPSFASAMRVAATDGKMEILHDLEGDWEPLAGGAEVGAMDQVRSGLDPSSGARFLLADGSVVVMGPESWLRLDEASFEGEQSRVLLRLLGGALRIVASETFPDKGRFEVETPTAVSAVHGTEFIVSYDPDKAQTEVTSLSGEVEVLGVLGVLGRPAVLESGMHTIVRRGAFPESPTILEPGDVAARRRALEFSVSSSDSLIAGYTGVGAGMPAPAPRRYARTSECARESGGMWRMRYRPVSRDGEVIDQPIREFAISPPGQTPPGSVRVVIGGN